MFLADELSGLEWLAIAIIVGGLASARAPGRRRGLRCSGPGCTAACIGTYTTLDIEGARKSSGFGYGSALIIGAALALSIAGCAAGRGPSVRPRAPRNWPRYSFGGVLTTTAYSMVLAAGRLAPAGYVASLRESSVVIAAVAGWVLLHERLGGPASLRAAVIAAGLVLLVVWRLRAFTGTVAAAPGGTSESPWVQNRVERSGTS